MKMRLLSAAKNLGEGHRRLLRLAAGDFWDNLDHEPSPEVAKNLAAIKRMPAVGTPYHEVMQWADARRARMKAPPVAWPQEFVDKYQASENFWPLVEHFDAERKRLKTCTHLKLIETTDGLEITRKGETLAVLERSKAMITAALETLP